MRKQNLFLFYKNNVRLMKQTILITGATSGFGKSIAETFAQNGWRVIINGRRKDRLARFAVELQEKFKVDVLQIPFDVRDRAAIQTAIESIPENWRNIRVLVNNAGLALGLSSIMDGNNDDWDTMLDTNVKGVLNVTKAFAPFLIANGNGHIINIGSIAGKEVYPNGNVYCASKFALDALSKSMRIDLLPYKVKVTSINPGLAETEFSVVRFKGDEERAKKVYEGFVPLYGNDIAEIAYFAVMRPAHVCMNEILVTPTAQATSRDVIKELQ